MKNRTLFIITSLNSGGLENYILRYLRYDTTLNVDILCKSGIGGVLEEKYLQRIPSSSIIKHSIGYFNPLDYIWLYQFIKRNSYETVCDFTGNFAGMSMLCAKLAKVKRRLTFYRNSLNHFKDTWYNRLYDNFVKSLVKKWSTGILSNSKAAFDNYFPKAVDSRFQVIYNGIDTSCISSKSKEDMRLKLGIPQQAFVVGHTARLDSAKNHDMILRVANTLCRKYSDLYFVMVGKGVEDYVKQQIPHPHVIAFDFRTDILDVLQAFDLYYFPSLWEGQPNALIEALISNLPFVASNIPAIKESVPSSLHEYLCDPNSYEENLNLIETSYRNEAVRKGAICGEWAREYFNSGKRFGEFKAVLNYE